MDLSVQQLRMLTEVAHQGTIAAAANSLGYTPSAVSQQLGSIEKSTGVAVLERVGRTVRLTDAGRELVHHAEIVLAQLEQAQAAVERVRSEVAGELRVGILESIAGSLLPVALPRIREDYPHLTIRTIQNETGSPTESLRSGDIDAFFHIDYPQAPADLGANTTRFPICHDWFRAVVHSTWTGPDVVELTDLDAEPLIASPPDMSCGRTVTFALLDAGITPDIVHQIDEYPAVLSLVAAGAGVGLIPELGVRNVPDGVRVLDLKEPFARSVEVVVRSSSTERPAIKAFIGAIEDAADEIGLDRRS